MMRQEIDSLFKDLEEKPLFYIESGSRLWGIASPDSDFDVRGFHLQSKDQYFDFKKHQDIIEVMDGDFDFKSLFHHYISLAKGNVNLMETGKKFTYKTVFYCIRGLLSADLATRKIIPELLIDDLFNQFEKENDVLKIAKNSLERKNQQTEKEEVIERDKQIILSAIKDFTKQLEIITPESSNNRDKLERILKEYSFNLKAEFYK